MREEIEINGKKYFYDSLSGEVDTDFGSPLVPGGNRYHSIYRRPAVNEAGEDVVLEYFPRNYVYKLEEELGYFNDELEYKIKALQEELNEIELENYFDWDNPIVCM